jgi:DNA-directed RNA polymerase beta subunit
LIQISRTIYSFNLKEALNTEIKQTNAPRNNRQSELINLDKDGVIKENSVFKPGSIFIGLEKPLREEEFTAQEKLINAIFAEKATARDVSIRAAKNKYGVIESVQKTNKEILLHVYECMPTEKEENYFFEKAKCVVDVFRQQVKKVTRLKEVVGVTEGIEQEEQDQIIEKSINNEITIEGDKRELKRVIKNYFRYAGGYQNENEKADNQLFNQIVLEIQNIYMLEIVEREIKIKTAN